MKRKLKLLLFSFLLIPLFPIIIYININSIFVDANNIDLYQLIIDRPLTFADSKTNIKTAFGNTIELQTNSLNVNNDYVITLNSGEYFKNNTPISGISSISITYSGGELQYSSSHYPINDELSEYSSIESNVEIFLDNNSNYFIFKCINDGPINISKIKISYSCQYIFENYTISFNTNGGSYIEPINIKEGNKITRPIDPIKEGFEFVDWYIDGGFEHKFDFNSPIYSDLILYAKYVEEDSKITLISPDNNSYIDLRNDDVKDFIDNYEKGYSFKYQTSYDHYQNKPLEFSWSSTIDYDYYIFNISELEDFSEYQSYICSGPYFSLKNVKTNSEYYWQVKGVKNNVSSVCREIRKVEIANYPRLLDIDGISNIRDIGGYLTSNGKNVKQGFIYRSANLDDISEYGKKQLLQDLNIKTEIDLRASEEASQNIEVNNYFNIQQGYWIDEVNGINIEKNWPNIKSTFEKFANSTSYPFIFHDDIGQDSVGTLAILLEGMLGVSLHNILLDYELSSFSKIVNIPNIIPVADKFTNQVNPLINYLKSFGDTQYTFQECVIKFLTDYVGVSSSTVEAIKNILLDTK